MELHTCQVVGTRHMVLVSNSSNIVCLGGETSYDVDFDVLSPKVLLLFSVPNIREGGVLPPLFELLSRSWLNSRIKKSCHLADPTHAVPHKLGCCVMTTVVRVMALVLP
jgi:hypothetical protein